MTPECTLNSAGLSETFDFLGTLSSRKWRLGNLVVKNFYGIQKSSSRFLMGYFPWHCIFNALIIMVFINIMWKFKMDDFFGAQFLNPWCCSINLHISKTRAHILKESYHTRLYFDKMIAEFSKFLTLFRCHRDPRVTV